jgi:IS4 transposase
MYHYDTFYHTKQLSIKRKKELLNEAKEKCFRWSVDKNELWVRVPVEMSWEDILAKLDKSCHFVFIHRKGYEEDQHGGDRWLLEIGFSTMAGVPDYYLWVDLDEKEIPYFVEKYQLTINQ